MRCHKVQRLLPDYIGDELSLKNRKQIEQHLEQCPACKAELAVLQTVWDSLVQETLPQRGEEFWQGFTARVMREVKKKRPAVHKTPLLFPGWRVLLPAAGAAAAVIAAVIVLRGGPGPGPGQGPGEQGTIAEVAQPFSVAPLAGEDEGFLGQVIGLNGGNGSTEGKGIALKPAEKAALAEAATQLDGDEDLSGQLDTLDERELERFDRLLSARYSLS
jgi:anti-sigma factor RsiW